MVHEAGAPHSGLHHRLERHSGSKGLNMSEQIALKRVHAHRLREVYRSAGWPYQDVVEVELLAAASGHSCRSNGA